MTEIRVVLADDQQLMRTGFRMILEEADGITVVGEAADGAAAVQSTRALEPDVVLLDVRMPGMDGIEAARQIAASGSDTQVLILTTFDLDEYAFAALRAGASGFLLKDAPVTELVQAIRAVAGGHAVVSPRITRLLLDAHVKHLPAESGTSADRALAVLTPREREVLLHVAQGLSNAEIADELGVSGLTVKTHVGAILSKLALRNRVAAVIFAYEVGLVS